MLCFHLSNICWFSNWLSRAKPSQALSLPFASLISHSVAAMVHHLIRTLLVLLFSHKGAKLPQLVTE